MKKYIQISSKVTINVTPGLLNINATNLRSPVADRMSVKPMWSKFRVLLEQNRTWYPSVIAEWDSVKEYVKEGLVIIGMESDVCDDPRAEEDYNRIVKAETKFEADVKMNDEILGVDKEMAKEIADTTYASVTKKTAPPKAGAKKTTTKKTAVKGSSAE